MAVSTSGGVACKLSYRRMVDILNTSSTRMWANAQPDGRPAEHRWRPLFNAIVWLTPTTRVPCSNAAKTRNPLKLPGVPQTNETISAASGPKFTTLWGHVEKILLLKRFFPIVDTCLSCEDIARQSCGMVPRWRHFWVLHLQRAACSTFQTCFEIRTRATPCVKVW